jgi:hypothetical protein
MAKIAKSKDTKNWRKGNAISKGDQIAVAWNADGSVAATSPVVEIGTGLYMNRRGFVLTAENGKVVHAASAEYVQGRY